MSSKKESYGINLRRFTNHKKVFPWKFIVKVILGIGLVIGAYYFTKELLAEKQMREMEMQPEEIEVEISTD